MKETKNMILAAGSYGVLLKENAETEELYEAAALLKILTILKLPEYSICFFKLCCRTKWQRKRLEKKIKKSVVWFHKVKGGKQPVYAVCGSAILLLQKIKNLEEVSVEEVSGYF